MLPQQPALNFDAANPSPTMAGTPLNVPAQSASQTDCAADDQVLASTTEVRLALPLPACATTHLREFVSPASGTDPDVNKDFYANETRNATRDRQAGIEKRNLEFAVGRYCARQALKRLQVTAEVPVDVDRKPVWPEGITGSISHSNHYTWAATAKTDAIQGIGVDTEIVVDDRTLRQVYKEIMVESELKFLKLIDGDVRRAFTIVFSAKESIFKCLYPTNEKFFGFHDVELVAANDSTVTFTQNPTNPNFLTAPRNLTVQFAVFQNDIFTTIWI